MNVRIPCVLAAGVALATLGCGDDAASPAAPTPVESPAAAATAALSILQVSAGDEYLTCAVTTDNRAWCWGTNSAGLGDGSSFESTHPVAVAGGLRFRQVSSGLRHACGVTTENRAYCWGNNADGELGDGTRVSRPTPVPVAGGRLFRQVEAGSFHTCGLTTENRAFCWGSGNQGQIGDGTANDRLVPRAVAGGRVWRLVSGGFLHTCAITTADQAFCWGRNEVGQLGDGSESNDRRLSPTPVAGGRLFRQLSAGFDHTCAVTRTARAYCWGGGGIGQIGDGKTIQQRREPRAVVGGLTFDRVTAGVFHTCGETTTNLAYCWGSNTYGGLGTGTAGAPVLTPAAVAGGLHFSQLSGGGFYTCGVTPGSVAYCWGRNLGSALGDGTRTDRHAPTRVSAPI